MIPSIQVKWILYNYISLFTQNHPLFSLSHIWTMTFLDTFSCYFFLVFLFVSLILFERGSICFLQCVTTIIQLICHSFYSWNPHSSSWEQPWSLLYSNSNLALFVFRTCYPPVKLGFLYTKFLGQFSWFFYPVFSDTQTQAFVQPLCIYQVLILYKAQYYYL